MSLGSLKDLYLDELGDLYAAEMQMIRALPRLVDETRAPKLRELLSKHCEESRLHLERLQLIFTHWGRRVPSTTCAGIAGIVQEADERLNQLTTDDVRDAAIIGIAQRIEHYEIAAYGCARTYARRLSRNDEARLLQETLDEEERADHRLTEIADAYINDDVRSASANRERAPRSREHPELDVEVAGPALDVAGPSLSTPQAGERIGSSSSARMVATGEIADETITPPHGDKLRTGI